MIKVILAEDQAVVREGIKFIIEQDKDIQVVGCAENGQEAYELCNDLKPDLVLMDIIMAGCDGVEGTRLIKSKYGSVKVLILSTFYDNEKVAKAVQYGADGYVLKDIRTEELIRTIKNITSGLKVVNENVYNMIIKQCGNCGAPQDRKAAAERFGLSERELEIIKMVVYGRNNKEIAHDIYLSEGRVKNILTGIMEKLGVKDRTQLAVFAVKNSLV